MRTKKKLPLSGDALLDNIFKVLMETLEKEIKRIYLKKDLRYPNKKRQKLHGLFIEKNGVIYLDKPKHRRESPIVLSTFVHELLHSALRRTNEWKICSLEKSLLEKRHGLTDAQKRYLKKYIPKHVVKHEPSLEKEEASDKSK